MKVVILAGGMGTSEELVLGRIYRDIRSFRIYDGATEVHKMSIARRAAQRARIAAASLPSMRNTTPAGCLCSGCISSSGEPIHRGQPL